MEQSFGNIQTFWRAQAEKPEHWHEAVFERFPAVVAHEYKRLQEELSCGRPFAALLQIKDVMEALLKFEVLLAYAWANEQPIPDFKKKVGCLITTRNLSLGAWMELAKRVIDFFKSSPVKMPLVLLNPLKAIRSYYNKKDFVNWRNETIGHGALAFEQDEAFQKELIEKLKQLCELFKSVESDLCRQRIFTDGGKLLLTGFSLARNLKVSDPTIVFAEEASGLSFTVSPYMVVQNGSVFFFDNQKKPLRTQSLCYTTGGRQSEPIEYFTELDNLRESQNLRLELPADSNFMSADEEQFLNRLGLAESFVEPTHLTGWVRAQIDGHEKGIYLLKMPRGTGKSSFAEKLNCLYPKPLRLDEDTDVRTYHISRTQIRSGADFARGIENQWQFAYEGSPWTGYTRVSEYIAQENTPAQAMAAFMNQVQEYTEYRRGCERVLMVMDGLDEIAEDEIWNYIPSEEMLNEGVHILLTSRDPEAEADLPRSLAEHLEKINVQGSLTVRRDSAENIQFLKAYAKKEGKTDKVQTEILIEQAEYRVLYLAMYCELLKGGLTMKELPSADKLCERYVGELQQRYGEKKTLELHGVLNVLSTVGRFEPMSLKEIAELAGFSTVTFNMLGIMNDIRTLLKVERGFGAGEQRYAGENRYVFANPDVANTLFEQIPSAKQTAKDAVQQVIEEMVCSEGGAQMSDAMLLVFAYAAELLEMGGAECPFFSEKQCKKVHLSLNLREDRNYILTLERMKKGYLQAIRFVAEEKSLGQGMLYGALGNILGILCKGKESIFYHGKAVEIFEKLWEAGKLSDANELAVEYNNFAGRLYIRGEIAQANSYYCKAIEIQEKLREERKLTAIDDLLISYSNYAVVLKSQGDISKAMSYSRKAVAICEMMHSKEGLPIGNKLADKYNDIAVMLMFTNETPEAMSYSRKAMEICETLYAEGRMSDAYDLAGKYNDMAVMLIFEGEILQALHYSRKALEICEMLYAEGRLTNELAMMYNQITITLEDQEVLHCYRRATEIQEKLYSEGRLPDADEIAITYHNLADALKDQKNIPQAIYYYGKAIEIRETLYAEGKDFDVMDLATVYAKIAYILQKESDLLQALYYCRKAMEIQEKLYAEGSLFNANDLAITYFNLAAGLEDQKDIPQAVHYYGKAIEIREKLYKEGKLSSPSVLIKTYTRIADLLEAQGDTAQAEIYRRKADDIQA